VGELAGDYDDDDSYRSTLLESVLDMSRKFSTFRATENVIRSMSLAGDGIITGVDFSIVSLPPEIPANVKFRDCDFSKSRVYLLEVCENFDERKRLFRRMSLTISSSCKQITLQYYWDVFFCPRIEIFKKKHIVQQALSRNRGCFFLFSYNSPTQELSDCKTKLHFT
jgi:hypothetical protein